MKALAGEGLRFLVSGAVNTLASYAAYLGLQLFMPYQLAYAIAFALGIVIAYRINLAYVFRAEHTRAKALAYPLVYVVQYAFGALALALLVEALGVPKEVAPLAVVVATIPLTFVLTRWVMRGKPTA